MKRFYLIAISLLGIFAPCGLMAAGDSTSSAKILSVHRYVDDSGEISTLSVSERNGDKGAVWFSGDHGYGIDVCDKGPYICLGDSFAVPRDLKSRLASAGREKYAENAELATEWQFKGLHFYVQPLRSVLPTPYRWARHIALLGQNVDVYLIVAWKQPITPDQIGFAPQVSQFLWSPKRGLVMISSKQTDFNVGDKDHPLTYPSFYDLVLMSNCGFGAPAACSNKGNNTNP